MTAQEILNKLPEQNILVVGDICLDRWCYYDPSAAEASRETGINRIGVVKVESTAGACGTIANNLSDLGVGRVSLLGVIGEDAHGEELFRCLAKRDIGVDLVIHSAGVQTFTYVKHINSDTGVEDLPRVDYINTRPLPAFLEAQMVQNIDSFAHLFDALIVCDQAETSAGGVITANVRAALARFASAHPGKIVWVDSRSRAEHFRNVYLKPNEQEAQESSLRLLGKNDPTAFTRTLELRALVVTQGDKGVACYEQHQTTHIPAPPVDKIVDICGAGDSFSAGAVSALVSGANLQEALAFGNLVASITITKRGTGTAHPEEVRAASRRHSILA